jgi:Family of unknown function (DUF5330)
MRVLRPLFFFGAIAILLPSPPGENGRSSLIASRSDISTPEIVHAASRTVSDVGDFCARQPMVCETAGFIATKLEAKAKYSAKLIYEWANEASSAPSGEDPFETEALATASLPAVADNGGMPSQNTLRVEDLIPDWRDPLPARKS